MLQQASKQFGGLSDKNLTFVTKQYVIQMGNIHRQLYHRKITQSRKSFSVEIDKLNDKNSLVRLI
jgi:hypothetical protein